MPNRDAVGHVLQRDWAYIATQKEANERLRSARKQQVLDYKRVAKTRENRIFGGEGEAERKNSVDLRVVCQDSYSPWDMLIGYHVQEGVSKLTNRRGKST